LGKNIQYLTINYNGNGQKFALRSEYSAKALQTLIDLQKLYYSSFTISPSIQNGYNNIKIERNLIGSDNIPVRNQLELLEFNFLKAGDLAAIYTFNDHKTLKEVEVLEGYKISSENQLLEYRNGGLVIGKLFGSEIILSLIDLGVGQKDELKDNYNKLNIGGYHDWNLPSFEILEFSDNWAKSNSINLFKSIGGLVTDSEKRFYNTDDKYIESNKSYGTCYSCRNEKPTVRLIRLNRTN
jgi:hypothetical protein